MTCIGNITFMDKENSARHYGITWKLRCFQFIPRWEFNQICHCELASNINNEKRLGK